MKEAVTSALNQFGKIDILINGKRQIVKIEIDIFNPHDVQFSCVRECFTCWTLCYQL